MMQSLHHNHNHFLHPSIKKHCNHDHLLHPFSNKGNPSFPRITPSRISYKPLYTSYKPLQISSALKKEDLLPNLSDPLFTSFWNNHPVVAVYKQVEAIVLKNESLQNSIFTSIGPFLIWIYPKLSKLFSIISFKDQVNEFVAENDVIVFTHNGEEIAGLVKKIGDKKTAVETECGLLYYDNPDFNELPLINVTSRSDEKDVMWGIHAVVEVNCELGEIDEVIKNIQSLLDKREMVKQNSKYNLVKLKSVAPRLLMLVNAFVKPSKLESPKFKSYQDIRRELLVEIREACEIKEDVIVFTHNGEEIAGLVKKIGDKKTAVETECGLLYYDNADFNKLPLYNVTSRSDDKEVMWGIHAVVEVKCELGEIDEVIKKIQWLLDKREMVKQNCKYNLVKLKSVAPRLLILVNSFVKPSDLKDPKFRRYLDIRRELLVEIRKACEIKGGRKWF